MAIQVEFSSPAPGSSVRRVFPVSGVWFEDGSPIRPTADTVYSLQQIVVRFGIGAPPVTAQFNLGGSWSANGTLPASANHGDAVAVTLVATVLYNSQSNPGEFGSESVRRTLNLGSVEK